MKKKVTFVDASQVPPPKYHSKFGQPDVPLLLLVKGIPYPLMGIYRKEQVTDENGKVTLNIANYSLYGKTGKWKIVAWRPMPKIPPEYHKVTGYDRLIADQERATARKRKAKVS